MLLLAATTRVDLVDEDYQIPAGDWKWVEVDLRQQPAVVMASYFVEGGTGQVRIALIARDDLDGSPRTRCSARRAAAAPARSPTASAIATVTPSW